MRVILLPGMDGTGILFSPLLKHLAKAFHPKVINYPGNGAMDYQQLTEYVLNELPTKEEFIIVAESFSGPIAYSIAKAPPEKLKSIILFATFMDVPNRLIGVIKYLPLAILLQIPIPKFIIKKFMFGAEIEQNIIDLFKESLQGVSSKVLAFRLREMAKLRGSLETITIPCTYVIAENDRLVSRSHEESFKKVAKSINTVVISGPHFILQAKPAECAKIIERACRLISNHSS